MIKIGDCIIAEETRRRSSDTKFDLRVLRAREIEALIDDRYEVIVPDPEDTDDRPRCLRYARAMALSHPAQNLWEWRKRWALWMTDSEVATIVAESSGRTHMLGADDVAQMLEVTLAERTRLGLKTIGAFDVSSEERREIARERKRKSDRERQAKKRAAESRQNREAYERESLSQTCPWELEGISRKTWERQRFKRDASLSRIEAVLIGDTPASTTGVCQKPFFKDGNPKLSLGAAGATGQGIDSPAERP